METGAFIYNKECSACFIANSLNPTDFCTCAFAPILKQVVQPFAHSRSCGDGTVTETLVEINKNQ